MQGLHSPLLSSPCFLSPSPGHFMSYLPMSYSPPQVVL